MLHHIYRNEHNIAPNEVSAVGYLNFNPQKQIHQTDFLRDPELQIATYKRNKAIKQEWLQMIKSCLFGR